MKKKPHNGYNVKVKPVLQKISKKKLSVSTYAMYGNRIKKKHTDYM